MTRKAVMFATLVLALMAPERRVIAAVQEAASAAKPAAALVNLNTATPAQLQALPGIGPKTAELIVEYRQKNGSFKKIEELMNIRGVGEKSFLKLKPLITVTPPKTERAGNSE